MNDTDVAIYRYGFWINQQAKYDVLFVASAKAVQEAHGKIVRIPASQGCPAIDMEFKPEHYRLLSRPGEGPSDVALFKRVGFPFLFNPLYYLA